MIENFKINEYGEIIREDYFFRQVHGAGVQILPFRRKVWKIYLLSLITFGIYGLVVAFAMAKETNISCAEDGKHTRGFWEVIGLSIITLGIYMIVWYCQWFSREASYLTRRGKKKVLTSGGYLGFVFLQIVINIVSNSLAYSNPEVSLICSLLNIVVAIIILTKVVTQHNKVNATYNEINNFVRKV